MSNFGHEKIRCQGYRIRLVLHDLNDFRKKSFLFVRFKYDRVVKNIIYKIWCFFYKDLCSSPNQLILSSAGFHIPAHESSFIVQPNELVDVHIDRREISSAVAPTDILENSEVAEITNLPETMVESVGVTLRRMREDAPTVEAKCRSMQVAAIVDGKSLTSDESTGRSDNDAPEANNDAVARTASKCVAFVSRDVPIVPPTQFSSTIKDKTATLNSLYRSQQSLTKDDPLSSTDVEITAEKSSVVAKRARTSSSSSEDSDSSSSDSDLDESVDRRVGEIKAGTVTASTPVISSSHTAPHEEVEVEVSTDSSNHAINNTEVNIPVVNDSEMVEDSEGLPPAADCPATSSTNPRKRRRRRRRGAKKIQPEDTESRVTFAAEPDQHWGRNWRTSTLSHAQIDKMKRTPSVAINWNTRPANRRFVFDEDGAIKSRDDEHDDSSSAVGNPSVTDSSRQSASEPVSVPPVPAGRTVEVRDRIDNGSMLRPQYLERGNREVHSSTSLTMVPRGVRMQPRTRIAAPRRHEANNSNVENCVNVSSANPEPNSSIVNRKPVDRVRESSVDSHSSSIQQKATVSLSTHVVATNGTSQPIEHLSNCSIDQLCERVMAGQREPLVIVRSQLSTPSGDQSRHSSSRASLTNGQSEIGGGAYSATRQHCLSVDSISNCNVVNQVGQNRRLQKQRVRAGSSPSHLEGDEESDEPLPTQRVPTVKNDQFYGQFPVLSKPPRVNDIIAFKRLELSADYTPNVSEYREARVLEPGSTGPDGPLVRLQLLDAPVVVPRRGRFELEDPEGDEVVDLCEESGLDEVEWRLLIEPRLMFP